MPHLQPHETFRFEDFELDVAAYQLRRNGRPVRLERQPMDLLILLVARRRQLVSRGEIVEALWGADVFVDVETGVHTAVRKIRQALRDSPDAPSFIETVPGKGYRFVATVDVLPASSPAAPTGAVPGIPASVVAAPLTVGGADPVAVRQVADRPVPVAGLLAAPRERFRAPHAVGLVVVALVVLALAGFLAWGWTRAVAPRSRITIAVLPFEDLSRNQQTEYLANGLAEDTIVSLGRIDPGRVSVIGRTSMMAYKGTSKSLAEIGRELGADYLVESSLRSEAGELRITARLIRAEDQVQVWSESFDRHASSILGVQQELSAAIAEQVQTRLSPERRHALARRHTQNAEAYDVFLRGRNFLSRRTPDGMRLAIESLQRATTLDPNYALAWSGLAEALSSSAINSDADPRDVWPRARQAALRAVAVNRDLAEAQQAIGYINWMYDWKWQPAEVAFRRAIELDPSFSQAHVSLGHLLSQMGRHAEGQTVIRRAREVDPLSPLAYALSSQVAYQARDSSSALELASRAIALNGDFWIGHQMSGQAHAGLGDADRALHALASAARLSGANSKALSLTGYILARAGRTAEARDVLATLEEASRQRYVPPYALALVHAGLGDTDAAFDWLDRAYTAHDVHLIFLPVDARWDPYRSDARYKELIARCGFAPGGGAVDATDRP
jgi:TolB-like protein/DNA-binding winged helix-turn-helix (wHTH) protein/Flp pilus assembly protein TadD